MDTKEQTELEKIKEEIFNEEFQENLNALPEEHRENVRNGMENFVEQFYKTVIEPLQK